MSDPFSIIKGKEKSAKEKGLINMPIKGLTDGPVQLPRAGKIRTGEMVETESGKMRPAKLDHFDFRDAPLVGEIYGDNCTELEIVFPSNDIDQAFSAWYKRWGQSSGLKCKGDGVTASMVDPDTGDFKEIKCGGTECSYFKKGQCRRSARLQFVIPNVAGGLAVYDITTGGRRSIKNVSSFFRSITAMPGGFAWKRMTLRLVEEEGQYTGNDGKTHKTRMFVLHLNFQQSPDALVEESMEQMAELQGRPGYELPEPEESKEDYSDEEEETDSNEKPLTDDELEAMAEEAEADEEVLEDAEVVEDDIADHLVELFEALGIPAKSAEGVGYMKKYRNSPEELVEVLETKLKAKNRSVGGRKRKSASKDSVEVPEF
jgi:hypothetical protein